MYHKIDAEGIYPVKKKFETIEQAPVLPNETELKELLANVSTLIKPITELLRKGTNWERSKKCQIAFDKQGNNCVHYYC